MSPRAAQYFVTALRSFLRYCFVEGVVETDLSPATLAVRGGVRYSLPKRIGRGDARALLDSCDRRLAGGRRDYAVIVTLLRLGLRASELAGLTLDDIDWRAAELVIRGKGGSCDRLPLPADVGAAIAAYLRRGRPHGDQRREVFVRTRAPCRAARPWWCVRDRAPSLPAGGGHACRGASSAPHCCVRDGRCRSSACADRSGAAASQSAEHRGLRARGSRSVAAVGTTVAWWRCRAMSGLHEHVDGVSAAASRAGVQAQA